jgi:hypothetical protein
MMVKWESIRDQIKALAKSNQLLPFLGAAVSYFQPTNLPLGSGLLHAALQGIFPGRNLFVLDKSNWTPEEIAIANHSPEVILQGLAEGLLFKVSVLTLDITLLGRACGPY